MWLKPGDCLKAWFNTSLFNYWVGMQQPPYGYQPPYPPPAPYGQPSYGFSHQRQDNGLLGNGNRFDIIINYIIIDYVIFS